jgi:G3E family GTPase
LSAFDAQTPRVPVLLVAGFLGSGKTTLVNRLLKLKDFSRAAVVINEYGEVSIDHVLVEAPRYRMRVVDSGCLCGHVRRDRVEPA